MEGLLVKAKQADYNEIVETASIQKNPMKWFRRFLQDRDWRILAGLGKSNFPWCWHNWHIYENGGRRRCCKCQKIQVMKYANMPFDPTGWHDL